MSKKTAGFRPVSKLDRDRFWWATFGVVLVGCLTTAWSNRDNLNTDAIAYGQIARHWMEGRVGLAISGYWGPMLSWLMAPLMLVGMPPFLAARLVLAASATLFWLAASGLFRASGLRRPSVVCSEWVVGVCVIAWTGQSISPDLPLSALALLAMQRLLSAGWPTDRRSQVVCGAAWGGAYLAKAIGLPLAIAAICALSLARIFLARHRFQISGEQADDAAVRAIFSACRRTLAVTGLVSLPWIIVLSVHYGHPTFSTAGKIAHAVVGPNDVDRYHPFARMFHTPEPGRITSWEDPSTMQYRFWSPLENASYRAHQIGLIQKNAETAVGLLGSFDSVGVGAIGLFGAAAGLAFRIRRNRSGGRILLWELAWIPVACLASLYLPVYLSWFDQRYFYMALPFLLSICFGGVERIGELTGTGLAASPLPQWTRVATGLLLLLFVAPNFRPLATALDGSPDPASSYARDLAARLRLLDLPGGVAGSAIVAGGRAGLYVAYLLDRQWLGDRLKPTPDEIASSGAALMVVTRRDPLGSELDRDQRFENLDGKLFQNTKEAEAYPLKVYRAHR